MEVLLPVMFLRTLLSDDFDWVDLIEERWAIMEKSSIKDEVTEFRRFSWLLVRKAALWKLTSNPCKYNQHFQGWLSTLQYSIQSKEVCIDDRCGEQWSCEDWLEEVRATDSRNSSWTFRRLRRRGYMEDKTKHPSTEDYSLLSDSSFRRSKCTSAVVCSEHNWPKRAWRHRPLTYLQFGCRAKNSQIYLPGLKYLI